MARAAISWTKKFVVAISGTLWAMRTQSSFWCHLPIALAVIIVAAILQVELWRWAVLLLTIGLVFAMELINTAIELLVRAASRARRSNRPSTRCCCRRGTVLPPSSRSLLAR